MISIVITVACPPQYQRKIVHIPSAERPSIVALLHYVRRGVFGHPECMDEDENFRKGSLVD